MAESTGRFPPTPTLHSAAKTPMAAKLGLPAAIMPKTAVMPIVRLKAHRRPKMSQPKPQNTAPKRRPMFWDRVRNGGRSGLNSFRMGVNIRDVTIGQRLSMAQPKPITMKSCHWYLPIPISWMALFSTLALAAYTGSRDSSSRTPSGAWSSGGISCVTCFECCSSVLVGISAMAEIAMTQYSWHSD
jgi:hypothetical protein